MLPKIITNKMVRTEHLPVFVVLAFTMVINAIRIHYQLFKNGDDYFFIQYMLDRSYWGILIGNTDRLFLLFYKPLSQINTVLAIIIGPALWLYAIYLVHVKLCTLLGIGRRLAIISWMLYVLMPQNMFVLIKTMTEHGQILCLQLLLIAIFYLVSKGLNFTTLMTYLVASIAFSLSHHAFIYMLIPVHGYLFMRSLVNGVSLKCALLFLVIIMSMLPALSQDTLAYYLWDKSYRKDNANYFIHYSETANSGRLDYFRDSKKLDAKQIVLKPIAYGDNTKLMLFLLKRESQKYKRYFLGPSLSEVKQLTTIYIYLFSMARLVVISFILMALIYLHTLYLNHHSTDFNAMTLIYFGLYIVATGLFSYGTQNYGTALRHHILSDYILLVLLMSLAVKMIASFSKDRLGTNLRHASIAV